jgi:hypothetical protein
MEKRARFTVSKRIVAYEVAALAGIILFIWLDEVLDLPHVLFGAPATPLNWEESLFEGVCVGLFGALLIGTTRKLLKRLNYLEGILPVCASCKKIRDETGNWQVIESYIRDRSAAEFSHGICPECAAKLYPDFNPYKKRVRPNQEADQGPSPAAR